MQANSIAPLDFMVWRTLTCLFLHAICCLVFNQSFTYPAENWMWVFARNIGGTATVISLFYGIKYLPIGIFQIIYNTSPFWASLLGFILLKERLKKVEIIAMVLSFILILLIALDDHK